MLALATALCFGNLAACGDDADESANTEGKSDAGTVNARGGDGGGGGSSGSSGAGGAMTAPPPEPVPCGSKLCNPPNNPLSGIASMFGGALGGGGLPSAGACCLDEAEGTCGITPDMGETCEAPAVADERCPAADFGMFGSFLGGSTMAGCCIDNMCGQDSALFGRGCVANAEAMEMISSLPLIGGMVKFPPTLACDRPVTDDADAGVADDQDAGI